MSHGHPDRPDARAFGPRLQEFATNTRSSWTGGRRKRVGPHRNGHGRTQDGSVVERSASQQAKQGRSAAEFKRYLLMAMGSSDEMRVWVRYGLDLGYIDEPTWRQWRDEYQSISKMLQGLARKWQVR